VRRANSFEQTAIRKFVEKNFSVGGRMRFGGVRAAAVTLFVRRRVRSCWGLWRMSVRGGDFWGRWGVKKVRREGIGKALLLSAMWGCMRWRYVYGIIGGVGPVEFYRKMVGRLRFRGVRRGFMGIF